MGDTFTIVAERAAIRCEVCHQADEFDAATGRCGRCEEIVRSFWNKEAMASQQALRRSWRRSFYYNFGFVAALLALFFEALYGYLIMQGVEVVADPDSLTDEMRHVNVLMLFIFRAMILVIPLIEVFLVARLVRLFRTRPRQV